MSDSQHRLSDERRVFLADDTDDIRLLLRTIFESAGFRVAAEAVDGDDAVRLWQELRDEGADDCAYVLDHNMPGRSGLTVASAILEGDPAAIVLLFSAYLTEEIRAEARALGIAACVSKDNILSLPDHPAIAG